MDNGSQNSDTQQPVRTVLYKLTESQKKIVMPALQNVAMAEAKAHEHRNILGSLLSMVYPEIGENPNIMFDDGAMEIVTFTQAAQTDGIHDRTGDASGAEPGDRPDGNTGGADRARGSRARRRVRG